MDATLWTGPTGFVPGTGFTSGVQLHQYCSMSHCSALGEQLRDGLGGWLVEQGVTQLGRLALCGFSAGGSLIKRVLESEADRRLVTVVQLADAMYTSAWEDKQLRRPPVIEGFFQYALEAASRPGKLFVATTSPNPNGAFASGNENNARLRQAIEERLDTPFEPIDFYGIEPAPERAFQLGGVILAEYPTMPLGHYHTKIADQIWAKIIRPLTNDGPSSRNDLGPGGAPSPATSGGSSALARGIGALLGGGVGYVLGSKLAR